MSDKTTLKVQVQRNAGHPWDQKRAGFDLQHIEADSQAEFDAAVESAVRKYWHPWLLGLVEGTARPGGVLYKPCGADSEWEDSPSRPHPGIMVSPEREPDDSPSFGM